MKWFLRHSGHFIHRAVNCTIIFISPSRLKQGITLKGPFILGSHFGAAYNFYHTPFLGALYFKQEIKEKLRCDVHVCITALGKMTTYQS